MKNIKLVTGSLSSLLETITNKNNAFETCFNLATNEVLLNNVQHIIKTCTFKYNHITLLCNIEISSQRLPLHTYLHIIS
jgi:hypothetical protein